MIARSFPPLARPIRVVAMKAWAFPDGATDHADMAAEWEAMRVWCEDYRLLGYRTKHELRRVSLKGAEMFILVAVAMKRPEHFDATR